MDKLNLPPPPSRDCRVVREVPTCGLRGSNSRAGSSGVSKVAGLVSLLIPVPGRHPLYFSCDKFKVFRAKKFSLGATSCKIEIE